jgi:hypothetical protein
MEEPTRCFMDVRDGVHLAPRTLFAAGIGADGVAGGELPQGLDTLGEDRCVTWVRQEAVVDRERRAGRVR